MTKKEQNRLCALNGGRGSGQTFRRLFEYYENKVASLKKENEELKDKLKNLASVAAVRLANWQKYEKENTNLKAQIEQMKCCENCIRYKPCITCNETIGNNCDYYSGGNVCNNWKN